MLDYINLKTLKENIIIYKQKYLHPIYDLKFLFQI